MRIPCIPVKTKWWPLLTLVLALVVVLSIAVTRDEPLTEQALMESFISAAESGVTPAGLVGPELQEGFQPCCGWPEFLERFWLLKHYLDYTHRFCNELTGT